MKKLFSIKETEGFLRVEVENKVYSVYDIKNKSYEFIDANGNTLHNYKRPKIKNPNKFSESIVEDIDDEDLVFNKYGIACGDNCLVDTEGNKITDTNFNLEDSCGEYDRYFTFGTITAEQEESISRCGTADGIMLDIYDTKTRSYVAKGVPECRINVSFYEGESEVILAAIKLIPEYETVDVCETGTIVARKDGWITVFYYYEE